MKRVAAIALLAACSFAPTDFDGTAYRCGPGSTCPDGFHCHQGACISGDASATIDAQPDAPADAAPVCDRNLIANPSFETGTSGWSGVGGPISQVNDGHSGDHALEKCSDGTGTYYNVSDNPDSVSDTEVGRTYFLRAWLRSETEQELNAVIRAKDDFDDPVAQHSTLVILKPDWQEVTVQHTVEDPFSAVVEVYFSAQDPALDNCFQLDAVCLVDQEP